MTKKVIIIDDSITLLNILKAAFSKKNWDVYIAQNVKSAYDIIYQIAPDLIITDALMPIKGGFQFVKSLRENPQLAKIPVILYSVLSGNYVKNYIREELGEYFLKKSENLNELFDLAYSAIRKHPVGENYKNEILLHNKKEETPISDVEILPEINKEDIINQIKKIRDYTSCDEILFSKLFSILHKMINYDLMMINTFSFEKGANCVYFDIRNIILSPILKNFILKKYNTKQSVLFKKYSPNLKSPVKIDEFNSKIEFSFFYKEKVDIAICFLNETDLSNDEIDNLKIALEDFIKTRYAFKSAKNKSIYSTSQNMFFEYDANSYYGIIEINNFQEIKSSLYDEELDELNSKILQKIMDFIETDEKLTKNYDEEYTVIIKAQNEKHAINRFRNICDSLNLLSYNNIILDVTIGVSPCDGTLNLYEVQKIARNALENTTKQEKVVLNYAGK